MIKRKKILLPILWFSILLTILLCFHEFFFFSYMESKSFDSSDMSLLDCEMQGDQFIPSAEHALLGMDNYGYCNSLKVNVTNENSDVVPIKVMGTQADGSFIDLATETVSPGTHNITFRFEGNTWNQVYLTFDKTLTITQVTACIRYLNLLRKSVYWLMAWCFAIVASGILAFFCYKNLFVKDISLTKATVRKSNIELLRILCMYMIVLHHLVVHGGAINMSDCNNKLIAYWLLPGGKIGFVAFIAISTWFLVDHKFNIQRYINTWLQVLFYSVSFTIIAFMLGREINLKDFLSTFLPISGNSHGFAASYLMFYLLFPFIALTLEKLNKRQARGLLLILFYAEILSKLIGSYNEYTQSLSSEVGLFIFCYVLSYNLKKWPICENILNNKKITGCCVLLVWVLVVQINYVNLWGGMTPTLKFLSYFIGDETSIFNIIAGYSLFFFFLNIDIPYNRFINFIAQGTFGVLLIHDHNFFRNVLWDKIIATNTWYYSKYFVLLMIAYSIGIFYVCTMIDFLRRVILESSISKCKLYSKIKVKLELLIPGVSYEKKSKQ